MGLVVDFQNKTVIGFTPRSSVPIHISAVDKTTISFFASDGYWSMSGTIDRATGMVLAASDRANPNTGNLVWALSYLLQCRSMQANAKDVMLGSRGLGERRRPAGIGPVGRRRGGTLPGRGYSFGYQTMIGGIAANGVRDRRISGQEV